MSEREHARPAGRQAPVPDGRRLQTVATPSEEKGRLVLAASQICASGWVCERVGGVIGRGGGDERREQSV